ncbi:anaerobic carbon-monoxide dehydrogenase catalytic subunit [Geobacter sulfurreducens subsp. ethanolicus]|uniref:anaerobic carbon-monoxide dehydrogenase catalytic subunit n=1 Tax=Geobacter sulfurreducens TaxID=35554 RepID=UPI002573F58A|nr:anaerobic carbon-monoxide dehydrogenase catalytic subunit [Geobacter sulfurreducens]BEH09909.1 anaerobic carbon-monoxide dehydrogenase catalytic subunit [Geobacter sulfurreducens subsp. ethanolicus]
MDQARNGHDSRSIDPAAKEMLRIADREGYATIWERYEQQQPQCSYGQLGTCCRICSMGPCRIDPFGDGPTRGVCGATADTMVARNLARMAAVGSSSHSDHGRKVALLLKAVANGSNTDYHIADPDKLTAVAERLGIPTAGRSTAEIAGDVAAVAIDCFGNQGEEPIVFMEKYMPRKRFQRLRELEETLYRTTGAKTGLLPRAIDREAVDILHRTHFGCDHDPLSLVAQSVRCSLSDGWGGSLIATELQDILLGSPTIRPVKANLGVLEAESVNVVVHGHEPILSAKVVEMAQSPECRAAAEAVGAKRVNVVGLCCTGNEVLLRQGVGMAGNESHSELAIMTGAVDAMVVDVQCIYPALADLASCFHTKFVTTSEQAKIPGALHIQFEEHEADAIATRIIKTAIDAFPNRNKARVYIPQHTSTAIVGFTVEEILKALGGTLQPLIDLIVTGTIKGVAGIVGCNNVKVQQDFFHRTLTEELIKRDILVIGTGCWAIAAAKSGLMDLPARELAGPGLQAVCGQLGIPPVLHMGSCVDCSRMLNLAGTLADHLQVDISDLPLVGSAPEWTTEKAVAIGTYFVGSGIPVHLWPLPPILGGPEVTKILTSDAKDVLGGWFFVEEDPKATADRMEQIIMERRAALGI